MIARPLAVLLPLLASTAAAAQSTNCLNMGGGMVHCDSMGGNGATSSTNCTTMNGMSSCTTMPMAPPVTGTAATGGTTFGVVGDLIARSRERSFQKKLGGLLQSGDCLGAANYAVASGRLDTGLAIRRSCQATPAAADAAPAAAPLEERLRAAAAKAQAAVPTPLDATTTVTKVEAIGSQLLISVQVVAGHSALTDADRSGIVDQICASPPMTDLFRSGATVRLRYRDAASREVGSVMVARRECGL